MSYQLEGALSTDRRAPKYKTYASSKESGEEEVAPAPAHARPPRSKRGPSRTSTKKRTRSGTTSSTQTSTPLAQNEDTVQGSIQFPLSSSVSVDLGSKTPTRETFDPSEIPQPKEQQPKDQPFPPSSFPQIPSEPEQSNAKPDVVNTVRTNGVGARGHRSKISIATDESDNDFQSAYSASPRNSYGAFDGQEEANSDDQNELVSSGLHRDRLTSAATIQSS